MRIKAFIVSLFIVHFSVIVSAQTTARMVLPSDIAASSQNYVNNRAPLPANPFIKLPVTSVTPRGWVGEMIRRQSDGLAGRLGEISIWLDKKDNAWLEEGGSHGCLFSAGAILWVMVPAHMIRSAWRGELRVTSNPKRAKS